MRKPRLLLAGGNHADIPLILAARELGYEVVTSGNAPADLGHPYADAYAGADFSDKDAMLRLAQELKINAVCAGCNDFAALSASWVAGQMGLPGHDAYEKSLTIHHKDRYRAYATALGVSTPRACSYTDKATAVTEIGSFRMPVMVKAVDLTGGKGISRVEQPEELPAAIDHSLQRSRQQTFVIEEFITGTRHGMSAFIVDRKVVFNFVDDEYYFDNQYLVAGTSAPGSVPESARLQLIQETERIAADLNLVDGIFHIQFILSDTQPVIIEICRRTPGDLYTRFVEYSTGVAYTMNLMKAFCGRTDFDFSGFDQPRNIARCCIMTRGTGKVRNVVYAPEVKDRVIDEFVWWNKPGGMKITDPLTQKCGIVFMQFSSREEMLDIAPRFQSLVTVEFEE